LLIFNQPITQKLARFYFQQIYSFGWKSVLLNKFILHKKIKLKTFDVQPFSEAFIRRSWYSFLQQAINWDEGSYQLSHTYDHFLDTTAGRHVMIQKN